MSCDVAALSFQAHSNYGTWSIDFSQTIKILKKLYHLMLCLYKMACKESLCILPLLGEGKMHIRKCNLQITPHFIRILKQQLYKSILLFHIKRPIQK